MVVDTLKGQRSWFVTGAAGFIGSHLVEQLLELDQKVIALDNFSTGKRENIEYLRNWAGAERAKLFHFFEQDIRDRDGVMDLVSRFSPDVVLHQAALGSVPRSIAEPVVSHQSNVDGFLNVLEAARLAGVKRFVYASSSSVYGDVQDESNSEDRIGQCLSPYAATKRTNEIYAQVFGRSYGMETVGLRYFNVFGPRQDPNGQYAAVIPRWLDAIDSGEQAVLYGDGSTSRDFCFVANVVQANLRAGTVEAHNAVINKVANIACGATTSLRNLFSMLKTEVSRVKGIDAASIPDPKEEPFRKGDIQHSLADISFARKALGYEPTDSVEEGIRKLVAYSVRR
jgi:UDP-N-acetylglucosamine 4-epimerase